MAGKGRTNSLRSLDRMPLSVRPVHFRLSRLFVLLAAIQILGGHWLALQSVAWLGMLADYSRGATLITAIEKTFDGEHPCSVADLIGVVVFAELRS